MSDFLLVRGIDAAAARPLFDAWKATRKWVRSVELRDAWEPQQLEINGRAAVQYMRGKHKVDLAELVLLIQQKGGRVLHLMLHRTGAERLEEDLGEWASRVIVKRKQVTSDWPKFEAPLLREIATALTGRRKAIGYHTALACEREVCKPDEGGMERLNFTAGVLRLCVWSDGVISLAVCRPGVGRGAGWAFKDIDTFHGDAGHVSAEDLIGMIEATLALPFGTQPEVSETNCGDCGREYIPMQVEMSTVCPAFTVVPSPAPYTAASAE